MSEEPTVNFNDGDIVWVKLGGCWWPGEVKDSSNVPVEVLENLRKPPLVIVKFFEEDSYEFVRNAGNIYSYTCEKKNEFIKKGLTSSRTRVPNLDKFKADIIAAEVKTGGNANILADPQFLPEKKINYSAEIFGTSTQKKSSSHRKKSRKSSSKPRKVDPLSHITHRRFLGFDDYESIVCIQYVGKDRVSASDDDDVKLLNAEPEEKFDCDFCSFSTTRLEVMTNHRLAHLNGSFGVRSPKKRRRSPNKKSKKDNRVTDTSDDEIPKPPRKRKQKSQSTSKTPKQRKVNKKIDIREDLLAEWDDEDDLDESAQDHSTAESDKLNDSSDLAKSLDETNKSKDNLDNSELDDAVPSCSKQTNGHEIEDVKEKPTETTDAEKSTKDAIKSCFDFDEEEEQDDVNIAGASTSTGRKIPRVIPEKRKSKDVDMEDTEDDVIRSDILEASESFNNTFSTNSVQNNADIDNSFNELMESTSVPDLPDISNSLKCEQNFHCGKTIKFPDKPEKVDPAESPTRKPQEVATKLTNPKKRFVKSFEDFEQLMNEQRKLKEEKFNPEPPPDFSGNLSPKSIDEKAKSSEYKSPAKATEAKPENKSPTKSPKNFQLDESDVGTSNNKSTSDLKISHLKSKIMSKIIEESDSVPSKLMTARSTRSSWKEEHKILDKSAKQVADKPKQFFKITKTDKSMSAQKDVESFKTVDIFQTSEKGMEQSTPEKLVGRRRSKEVYPIRKTIWTSKNSPVKEVEPAPKPADDAANVDPENTLITNLRSRIYRKLKDEVPVVPKKKVKVEEDALKKEEMEKNVAEKLVAESEEKPKAKFTPAELSKAKDVKNEEKEISRETENLDNKDSSETIVEVLEKQGSNAETCEPAAASVTLENYKTSPIKTVKPIESPKKLVEGAEKNKEEIEIKKIPESENKVVTTDSLTPPKKDVNSDAVLGKSDANKVIETNLDNQTNSEKASPSKESNKILDNILYEKLDDAIIDPIRKIPPINESELIEIEGNFNVVSEKELAYGQVEITANVSPNKKPVTLMNFSMDYSETQSNTTPEIELKPKSKETTPEKVKEPTASKVQDPPELNEAKTTVRQTFKSPLKEVIKTPVKETPRVPAKETVTAPIKETLATPVKEALPTPVKETSATIPASNKCDSNKKPLNVFKGPVTTKASPLPQLTQSVARSDFDFEDIIPSQVISARKEQSPDVSKSKPLDRATYGPEAKDKLVDARNDLKIVTKCQKMSAKIVTTKTGAVSRVAKPSGSKLTILSEKIIKPAYNVQKTPGLISLHDQNDGKKVTGEDARPKIGGKAKILQQTIITPAGEIIQPAVSQSEDNVFDINSMPIVLTDSDNLTPESVENMPIVMGNESFQTGVASEKTVSNILKKVHNRILNKPQQQQILKSPQTSTPIQKKPVPRILQTTGNKMKTSSPYLTNTSKPGKYIILPQSATSPAKPTGKKSIIVKKPPGYPPNVIQQKISSVHPESTGNKIMIVTNQQGQQQRLLLTPAQQKMLGYQNQSPKITKATPGMLKSNIISKSVLSKAEAGTSGLLSKNMVLTQTQKLVGVSSSQGLITTNKLLVGSSQQMKPMKTVNKKSIPNQKIINTQSQQKPQKTILIKNQLGQTVRKIQGTDDALLDKQVAEQLEAIKASSGIRFQQQKQEILNYKSTPKTSLRRSYSKKQNLIEVSKAQPQVLPKIPVTKSMVTKTEPPVPPLSPLASDNKPKESSPPSAETKPGDRPLNQLVIQDAMGNQTTITEGQILALPSETVDGQPQSYMLVTLDEAGNLTPLNNEALMSLDPSLVPGGELNNMVLQIDQSGTATTIAQPEEKLPESPTVTETTKAVLEPIVAPAPSQPPPMPKPEEKELVVEQENIIVGASESQPVPTSAVNEAGQQLIVTGDPIATQKFLESLSEGTTDLSNILANAEGSIIIQADGQQIYINTNSDNQMLLSVNNDNLNTTDNAESAGNPVFGTQPNKFQDILAAALADTDFQQDQHTAQSKIQSQLSPNSTLYPMNVGNVLETSLTLSSPIMTPLEVPSTNSKKIVDDEADILSQVPKNVDLPITITDPNISQTVSQQQVALMASELHNNLELSLPISESAISASSVGLNSPSFGYSLPALEETVDVNQKPFNSSMPLLTEDVEETPVTSAAAVVEATPPQPPTPPPLPPTVTEESLKEPKVQLEENKVEDIFDIPLPPMDEDLSDNEDKTKSVSADSGLLEEEGLCTLGGAMCSSLSEPPPDMFDLPSGFISKPANDIPVTSTNDLSSKFELNDEKNCNEQSDVAVPLDLNSPVGSSEDSFEIPIQAEIVTSNIQLENNSTISNENVEIQSNNCKFD